MPNIESSILSLYNYSQDKLYIIRKYLKEYILKEWVRASRLSAAVSILLIKKLGKDIQFCVNYWGLNNIIVKNQYLLLLIRETLDRLF